MGKVIFSFWLLPSCVCYLLSGTQTWLCIRITPYEESEHTCVDSISQARERVPLERETRDRGVWTWNGDTPLFCIMQVVCVLLCMCTVHLKFADSTFQRP